MELYNFDSFFIIKNVEQKTTVNSKYFDSFEKVFLLNRFYKAVLKFNRSLEFLWSLEFNLAFGIQ